MLGNIVLAGVSWLLFFFVLKKPFFQTWFTPFEQRIREIGTGITLVIIAFATPLLIKTVVYNIEWSFNDSANLTEIAHALYFYFNSVVFEELIFRGALLALLIHYTSTKTGVIVSAISFGVYHWFSYGMFGSGIVPMVYVFVLTGGMGLVYAYMYSKTNSVLLPIVVHLGWNFQSALFLDYQPFGQLLFSASVNRELSDLADFGLQAGGDILSMLLLYFGFLFYFRRTKKKNEYPSDGLPA